jgi:hypothetical protein
MSDDLLTLTPQQIFEIRARVAKKAFNHIQVWHGFPYDLKEKRSQDPRKIFKKEAGQWHLWYFGGAFVGGRKIAGRYYMGKRPGAGTLGLYNTKISIRYANPKTAGEKANVFTTFKGQRVFDYAEYVLTGDPLSKSGFDLDAAVTEALEEWLNQL